MLPLELSAILSTIIKLTLVVKTFVLSFFQWPFYTGYMGAQWLSGRVLNSSPKGHRFEHHRVHCVVVLEQDTFILA